MAYDVEAVKRQWEGYETARQWGRYPVEHEPIRRHCHMLELWIENAGEVTVPGTATVILPAAS